MSNPVRLAMTHHGIVSPGLVLKAASVAHIRPFVGCAFLEQETGGGQNIYGHDVSSSGCPMPFWGHGAVTALNYREYLIQRDVDLKRWGHRCQGVGPMQLTSSGFQDHADTLGGCWDPYWNMVVAFSAIAGYRRSGMSLHQTAAAYNGSEAYADVMDTRFTKWRQIMRTARGQ